METLGSLQSLPPASGCEAKVCLTAHYHSVCMCVCVFVCVPVAIQRTAFFGTLVWFYFSDMAVAAWCMFIFSIKFLVSACLIKM